MNDQYQFVSNALNFQSDSDAHYILFSGNDICHGFILGKDIALFKS